MLLRVKFLKSHASGRILTTRLLAFVYEIRKIAIYYSKMKRNFITCPTVQNAKITVGMTKSENYIVACDRLFVGSASISRCSAHSALIYEN